MLDQIVSTEVEWQNPWPTVEKTWQDLWEFKIPQTEPAAFAAANDLEAHSESTHEGLMHWVDIWNAQTNMSGTISATLSVLNKPYIVFNCNRNECSRPWVDELSEIRPLTLRVVSEQSATDFRPIVKSLTREVKRPVTPSRQREIEWLSSNTDRLDSYLGNWIALEGDKIIAWGSDEIEVEMQAKAKGVEVPLLFRIPAETDKPFFGYSLYDSSNIR